MARKKRGRGRGSKAIPGVQTAIIAYPLLMAYKQAGFTAQLPDQMVFNLTGYSPTLNKWNEPQRAVGLAVALLAASTIGAKLANKSGANRLMKKVSGGMLKIA